MMTVHVQCLSNLKWQRNQNGKLHITLLTTNLSRCCHIVVCSRIHAFNLSAIGSPTPCDTKPLNFYKKFYQNMSAICRVGFLFVCMILTSLFSTCRLYEDRQKPADGTQGLTLTKGIFYMHYHINIIKHGTAFVELLSSTG